MMRVTLQLFLLLAVAAAGCVGPSARQRSAPVPRPSSGEERSPALSTQCMETFTIEQSNTYLEEIRGVHGVKLSDWQKELPAEVIDAQRHVPAACTAQYRLGESPLFWFSPGSRLMVVSAGHFSTLQVADATRGRPGQRQVMGRATAAVLTGIPRRTLVRFLLAATAIHTYWHIKADLCLEREHQQPDGTYQAFFSGKHLYFTNEENEDVYRFGVEVSKDGELTLVGLQ